MILVRKPRHRKGLDIWLPPIDADGSGSRGNCQDFGIINLCGNTRPKISDFFDISHTTNGLNFNLPFDSIKDYTRGLYFPG